MTPSTRPIRLHGRFDSEVTYAERDAWARENDRVTAAYDARRLKYAAVYGAASVGLADPHAVCPCREGAQAHLYRKADDAYTPAGRAPVAFRCLFCYAPRPF